MDDQRKFSKQAYGLEAPLPPDFVGEQISRGQSRGIIYWDKLADTPPFVMEKARDLGHPTMMMDWFSVLVENPPDENRLRRFVFDQRQLLDVFRGRVRIGNLPEDAKIVSVHATSEYHRGGVMLVVWSNTFSEVPDGELIPIGFDLTYEAVPAASWED
jgi:hypothetical protein